VVPALFNVLRFPANVAVFMKPLRLQLALFVFITTMTLGDPIFH